MKKVVFVLAMAVSASAYAALLTGESVQGVKKVCIYSDGSTVTVSAAAVCPLTH